jgi:uncharacterized ion transporter superfamily protein YfcC
VVWFALLIIAQIFVIRYAEKVRVSPEKSLVYGMKLDHLEVDADDDSRELSLRQMLALLVFAATVITIAVGAKFYGWGPIEMSATFIISGILGGLTVGYSPNRIAEEMLTGARLILVGVLGVGLAFAIRTALVEGQIADTLIYNIAGMLKGLPQSVTVLGMFFAQTIINLIIPSSSGQAMATLPIMLPIAEIVKVNPQISILAFQFGDGLSNIIYPTVGVLIGFLSYTKVSFTRWFRFILPFFLICSGFLMMSLIVATAINLQ